MFCGHCGIKNEDDARFCVNCGQPINSMQYNEPEFSIKNLKIKGIKRRRWSLVAVSCGLVAIIGIVIVAFFLLAKEDETLSPEYQELLNEGRRLEDEKQTKEAINCYSQAISLDSTKPQAFERLSQIYLNSGNIVSAYNVLDDAPVKVREELDILVSEIDTAMNRTFLETRYDDGANIYYGVTNLSGNEVIPCIYDSVQWDKESADFGNVIFTVQQDGYVGYIDENGVVITDMLYTLEEDKYTGGNFFKDYAVVALNGKYGVIDRNGNYFLEPVYDDIKTLGLIDDVEYFAISNEAGGKDVIKSTGESTDFKDAYTEVNRLKGKKDYLIEGDSPYEYIYTDDTSIFLDYFSLSGNDNVSILNENFSLILSSTDSDFAYFRVGSGFIVCGFQIGDKMEFGIYNYNFESVIDGRFDAIAIDAWRYTSGNFVAAQQGDQIYIFNAQGDLESSFSCSYDLHWVMFSDKRDGILLVRDDNLKYGLVDWQGNLINNTFYEYIQEVTGFYCATDFAVDCSLVLVKLNGACGILDYASEKYVIPPKYADVKMNSMGGFIAENYDGSKIIFDSQGRQLQKGDFQEYFGYYLTWENDDSGDRHLGIVDNNGDIVISEVENYTHINSITNGTFTELLAFIVLKDGEWGLVDTKGKVVISVGTFDSFADQYGNYFPIYEPENNLLQVQQGTQYGYADYNGNWWITFDYSDKNASLERNVLESENVENNKILNEYFSETLNSEELGPYCQNVDFSGNGDFNTLENEAYLPEAILYAGIEDYDGNGSDELHIIYNKNNYNDGGLMCHVVTWNVYEIENDNVVLKDSRTLGTPIATENYSVFNFYEFKQEEKILLYTEDVASSVESNHTSFINIYEYTNGKIQTKISLYSLNNNDEESYTLYKANAGRLSGMLGPLFMLDGGMIPEGVVVETLLDKEQDISLFIQRINDNLSTWDICIDINTRDFSKDTEIISANPECFSKKLFGLKINIISWNKASGECEYEYHASSNTDEGR